MVHTSTGHDMWTCVITCAAAIMVHGTYTGHDVCTMACVLTCPAAIMVYNRHDVYTFVIICAAAIGQPSGFILGMMRIHLLLSVLQPSPNHQGRYWA